MPLFHFGSRSHTRTSPYRIAAERDPNSLRQQLPYTLLMDTRQAESSRMNGCHQPDRKTLDYRQRECKKPCSFSWVRSLISTLCSSFRNLSSAKITQGHSIIQETSEVTTSEITDSWLGLPLHTQDQSTSLEWISLVVSL